MSRLRGILLLLAGAVLASGLWQLWQYQTARSPLTVPKGVTSERIARTYDLHDLGVADLNADGRLDIYSINHSNRQTLLLAQPNAGYAQRLVELGLSQSAEFPGIEIGDERPALDGPGLYIYWEHGRLRLVSTADFSAQGTFRLPRELHIRSRGGAVVTRLDETLHQFELPAGSEIVIASWRYYFRPEFELAPAVPLDRVFVGPGRVSPQQARFRLTEQDRHGAAWADYDGDGQTDVFFVRGGDEGRLAETDPAAEDELFVGTDGRFSRHPAGSGLVKAGMPGRSVQWVDVNGDGRLDLFVVNGRVEPPNQDAPNQLFLQQEDGTFREAAASHNLDTPGQGRAVWLRLAPGHERALLWANARSVQLFRKQGSTFQPTEIAPLSGEPTQVTIGDYDSDGQTDVLLASRKGNLLLQQQDGQFVAVPLAALGLPERSFAASWVDVDNDGRLDLHTLPQGLYRQNRDGQFERTGKFSFRSSNLLSDRRVLCTWFDADNNGTRDLLVSIPNPLSSLRAQLEKVVQRKPLFRPRAWDLYLYRVPPPPDHHWLHVALIGPKSNRPAVGARIELWHGDRYQMSEVGQAEGAQHSQGHYRVYFGLGANSAPVDLRILWPDGRRQSIPAANPNQLLVVRHDDAPALDPIISVDPSVSVLQ